MSDNICHRFIQSSQRNHNRLAIQYKKGGLWVDLTWAHYQENIESFAAGLSALGISKGDRVAIFANTRYEWAVCDLANLGIGAITIPIYQSNTSEDCQYILNNSGASALIVEDINLYNRIRDLLPSLKKLKHVILINPSKNQFQDKTLSYADVQANGT
jgi:long-chain acyl-CoA synthetase